MTEHSFVRAKHYIGRILIFTPLVGAFWVWSLAGIVLSVVSIVLYFTVHMLLDEGREAYKRVYSNKEITLLCTDGTSECFRLEDIDCYCKLPLRMGFRDSGKCNAGVTVLPASIVVKLKEVKIPIQIELSVLGCDLRHLIETKTRRVPRINICPPISAWVSVLQGAYVVLTVFSSLYIAGLLSLHYR